MMRKGLVFSVLALFILVPLVYFLFVYQDDSASKVKGVSSSAVSVPVAGTSVAVTSVGKSWELFAFLCETKDSCESSLMSGERLSIVGGGTMQERRFFFKPTPKWDDYSYLKIFISPVGRASSGSFSVVGIGDVPNSEVVKIKKDSVSNDVLLIPLDPVREAYIPSGFFTDAPDITDISITL